MSNKRTINMTVMYTGNGVMVPLKFVMENGKSFKIDKVLDVQQGFSLKNEVFGERYECSVGIETVCFIFDKNLWYLDL